MPTMDLAIETFLVLRRKFFDAKCNPVSFPLRDKRNTQDDPLDEYVSKVLKENITSDATCIKAPGPLITPDLVVFRPSLCKKSNRLQLRSDLTRIVAIEVKKLERTKGGGIARPSGLDYNTTPPCGTVRIYDSADQPIDVRCFYLFICQEPDTNREHHYKLTALALCDGNLLNQDFDYYLSIVGKRTKQIGLGTYKDGFDRQRPMLVFANPLGAKELDHSVTLIHPDKDLQRLRKELSLVAVIQRSTSESKRKEFYCYRNKSDVPGDWETATLEDPFPTPEREEKTQPRGRFRLDFRLPK